MANPAFSSIRMHALRLWHASDAGSPLGVHGDPVTAQVPMARALLDDEEQTRLRAWALEVDDGLPLPQRAEHEVVAVVAAAVARGSLRTVGRPLTWLPLAPVRREAAPASSRAAPVRTAPVAAAPAPDSTFDRDLDVPAMVAALTQAARDGTPFCEECAKAAAAQRGETPATSTP
jgi:hypothetical protein